MRCILNIGGMGGNLYREKKRIIFTLEEKEKRRVRGGATGDF